MKLHPTGHAACLVLACTIILKVNSAPLEDNTWAQPGATDSLSPLTVRPLGTSVVPQDQTKQPNWSTKVKRTTSWSDTSSDESDEKKDNITSPSESKEAPNDRTRRAYSHIWRNERDTDSASSQDSVEVSKRSADDDSPNGNEETGGDNDDDDDSTDSSPDKDDTSTEDSVDDPSDRRRRRSANCEQRQKRQVREDSNEDDDGGLTREAAVVSPIRRRRSPEQKEDTDVSTDAPLNYDDASPDPTEGTESTESTETTTRRRATAVSAVGKLDGSPVIVVAPSSVPVKQIPQALNNTLQTLQQRINTFENALTGSQSTVPTVGVLAGASTKQDKDTIIHTISSAQYIVH